MENLTGSMERNGARRFTPPIPATAKTCSLVPTADNTGFSETNAYDLDIIGAGPAGMTASIHAIRANLRLTAFVLQMD